MISPAILGTATFIDEELDDNDTLNEKVPDKMKIATMNKAAYMTIFFTQYTLTKFIQLVVDVYDL